MRQGGREHRRACPTATADHRDDRPATTVVAGGFDGVGQFGHQYAVLGRQGDDVLGADRYSGFPVGDQRLTAAHQHDAATPRQRTVSAAASGLHIEQYSHRAGPHLAARRVGCVHDVKSGCRGDSVHIIAQGRVADQRQDLVCCRHDPTLRAGADQAPLRRRSLWIKRDVWTNRAVCKW